MRILSSYDLKNDFDILSYDKFNFIKYLSTPSNNNQFQILYYVNDIDILYISNHGIFLINKYELDILPDFVKYRDYIFVNYDMFLYFRRKYNLFYIKELYNNLLKQSNNDNIKKEYKKLIDILNLNKDYTKTTKQLMKENNINLFNVLYY